MLYNLVTTLGILLKIQCSSKTSWLLSDQLYTIIIVYIYHDVMPKISQNSRKNTVGCLKSIDNNCAQYVLCTRGTEQQHRCS